MMAQDCVLLDMFFQPSGIPPGSASSFLTLLKDISATIRAVSVIFDAG